MVRAVLNLAMPKNRDTATVFASPHSGRNYPWSFIRSSQLDELTIRSSEDAFVDRLFDAAPLCGAPLLSTNIPRAYVDLNRAEDEFDPALIAGARQKGHNPRISSGLGVIPRVVAGGREIRQGKISITEARNRLRDCYHPYHDKLKSLLDDARKTYGYSLLFDCHSMPHDALANTSYAFKKLPEIVLGDRFGASAAPELIEETESAFKAAGFTVSRNLPFAGAFVVQQYGAPISGRHAIQIEIDRSLYMDETTLTLRPDFEDLRSALRPVLSRLADLGRQKLQLAAE